MLTIKQINEISFGKAGFSGYKPEDVDQFIDEVVDSFRQLEAERDDAVSKAAELSKQNAELQEKLAVLAQRVETYRTNEDGIKDMLFNAQKSARDIEQGAKEKAELMIADAQESAKKLLADAKVTATSLAEEYMSQAEAKKEELEEIKRQVSAFRASLMEMYKKHLECIDHIPSFRPKEKENPEPKETEAESETPKQEEPQPAVTEEKPAEVSEKAAEDPSEETAAKAEEPLTVAPAVADEDDDLDAEPEPAPMPQRDREIRRNERPQPSRPRPQGTLNDKVDFTRGSRQYPNDDDLSEVGIDMKSYRDIPESLQRERSDHFSHLEFGDDVDLGQKKRRK